VPPIVPIFRVNSLDTALDTLKMRADSIENTGSSGNLASLSASNADMDLRMTQTDDDGAYVSVRDLNNHLDFNTNVDSGDKKRNGSRQGHLSAHDSKQVKSKRHSHNRQDIRAKDSLPLELNARVGSTGRSGGSGGSVSHQRDLHGTLFRLMKQQV